MGLFSKLRHELIDIIEWIDDSRHTLVWRFPRYQNEIKNGAQLIVRPGQTAVFVTQGQVADVFEPGHYELSTKNLPILSTILGWKYGFDSPFKSEVYFVSSRQVTDLKWGTPNPIMLRDPEFGPIRLRAFGSYTLKATNPKRLLEELVGTDGVFETDELETMMRSVITSSFADVLGRSEFAALDLAQKYQELAAEVRNDVTGNVGGEYGLDVPQLFVVNISLPEEVEKALDRRTSMGVIGDMNRYQQFQMANAMEQAALNPAGGGAADGMGLGMGFAMANQMAQSMGRPGTGLGTAAPPPPPTQTVWHLHENGQTTGPFTVAQLQQWIQSGRITGSTLLWAQGIPAWTAAGQLPQFAGSFAAPPPPPPPPPPGA